MTESGKDAGTTLPADPAAPPGKKIFTVGTLKYTTFGLIMLFVWLLWGDFCWSLLDGAIPSIMPLKLNRMGASDTMLSFLIRTLGLAISFVFAPMVSFKSDRYRSRWGRRIPFLIWSTPFVGLFMILMGCYEDVTQFILGDAQQATLLGLELTRTGVTLILFAILLVGFDIANIFVNTVYWYFFNDVVPTQFLSRFLALFRIVGMLSGMIYNYFLLEHALTHFRIMFILGGIAYVIGFLLMCFFVKEGEYPPPPENIDKRKGFVSSIKTFAKECFTHRFYWYFFLFGALFNLSWCSGLFQIIRNTGPLELTLKQLGMMAVYLTPLGLLLQYPAGWLSDKFNPIRVYVAVTCITIFSNVLQCVFLFRDFNPFGNLMMMYFIQLFFMPFSSVQGAAEMPMYMRLLPKDRYGQFCSANGMVRAFVTMIGSVVAGWFIGHLGTLPVNDYFAATTGADVVATWTPEASWTEEAVGPWVVNYIDSTDRSGVVTVPGATAVKVYFEAIHPESEKDHVTTDADPANNWNAETNETFSGVRKGDSITLRQLSDVPATGNFRVTRVAYQGTKTGDIERSGPLWDVASTFPLFGRVVNADGGAGVEGVLVSFSKSYGRVKGKTPKAVATDKDGNWRQDGFITGNSYESILTKRQPNGKWTFRFAANGKDKVEIFGARGSLAAAASWESSWTDASLGSWWSGPLAIDYVDSTERVGTITVPGATAIKVYFESIGPGANNDRLTTDAGDAWTGLANKVSSGKKAGDTITLRQLADATATGNFRITKISYQGEKTGDLSRAGALWDAPDTFTLSGRVVTRSDGKGVAGTTVSFGRENANHFWEKWLGSSPAPVKTDADGNWTQSGFVRGNVYNMTVTKEQNGGTWLFSPPTQVLPGASSNVRTEATCITPDEWTELDLGRLRVNYAASIDRTGTITVPGATALIVYFDDIVSAAGKDHVTTDADPANDWSGDFSGVYSSTKSGDTMRIRLATGEDTTGSLTIRKVLYKGTRTGEVLKEGSLWGYALSGKVCNGSLEGIGLAGAQVSFTLTKGEGELPGPVTTNAKGEWKQAGFTRGCRYAVSVSKPENDGAWVFGKSVRGDGKYRYYPVWTIIFQIFGLTLLIILYREWKKRGGDKGYTPPEV